LTNVQGRQLNGAADTCTQSVGRGSGRFVHLEQARSVLMPFAQRWSHAFDNPESVAIRDAFGSVLPQVAP